MQRIRLSPRFIAILQVVFVTFLWSTSWVLIKKGLRDEIPPLTFAGLRYTLAFACLIPIVIRNPVHRAAVRSLPRGLWLRLAVLGLLLYSVTQGAQFVGLAHLPAVTVNLLLSFSAVAIGLLSIVTLGEPPSGLQWAGIGIYLCGAAVYFYPVTLGRNDILGVLVVLMAVLSNATASLIGRSLNRERILHPLPMTATSMGVGSLVLLAAGLLTEPFPHLTVGSIAIIGWLAVVNTAFGFTLYNHTLRTLSALENAIVLNLMMVFIPILAWLFLDEAISLKMALGLILAGCGILTVQVRTLPKRWANGGIVARQAGLK